MNKTTVFSAVAALGLASGAQAITIEGTEVGSIDDLLCGIDSTESGQAYEEAQLEACVLDELSLVVDVTLESNIDISDAEIDLSAGALNAIDVSPDEPGFFLLKFGTGGTGNDMFFFQNLADLGWLVWDEGDLLAAGLPEGHVNSISHYTYGGGGTTSVPEPSTLALLGIGLLGLGALRRRRPN